MVFASAGRDGTIRIWDARSSSRSCVMDDEDEDDGVGFTPVLTINAAHEAGPASAMAGDSKGRKPPRSGASKRRKNLPAPAGITRLVLPRRRRGPQTSQWRFCQRHRQVLGPSPRASVST